MSDKNSTPGAVPSPPSGASAATGDKVSEAASAATRDKVSTADSATPGTPGLPDLQSHVEAPTWLSGGEDHDGQVWSGAFNIEADSKGGADSKGEADGATAGKDADATDDAEAGKEAADESGLPAEPEVTNPEDVTLDKPVLSTPEVGSEAAEAASLDETAAEVKAVEAEAADAAVLTDPAANRPVPNQPAADGAATDGPKAEAPAGDSSKTENSKADAPADDRPATDSTTAVDHTSGIAAAAPMTGEHPSSEVQEEAGSADKSPASEASGSKAPAPGSRRALRTAATPAAGSKGNGNANSNSNGSSKRLLLIIGGIAAIAILAVVLFIVLGNSEKDPGVLEEDVAPIELETGACLSGFTGVNEPTTVVTCETPHNAQLVATATYPEDDEFPGADALSQRADEVCSGVRYTEAATQSADLGLQVSKAVPTPESWDDGDRRVDCFVVADEGQELTESLIEQ